ELSALRSFPADAQLLTVSVDSLFALRAWADQEGYAFPLLSDFWPHGQVARAYGVFDEEKGVARRGTFVIDGDGVIRWSVVNPIGEPRDVADYLKALADLAGTEETMPCYRCGARQTDPVRGVSPWKRGVRHGSQVLICPDCQRTHDLELDTCAGCGSVALICRLGEVECRACGAV